MPPMPPMPPPGMAGIPPSFFGFSATMASVVIRSPAIDAAFCSAARTTLVGSMMPLVTHVDVLAVLGVEAVGILILFQDLADDDGAVLARIDRDLACRPAESALRTISTPVFWSSFCARSFFSTSVARSSATPPPGRMPSSTAARVACIASSTRSLRSFTSISVAPPTRITATPPASLASRSCSFSLS